MPLHDASRRGVIAAERRWHEEEAQRRYPLDVLLYAPPAFDALVDAAFAFLEMRPGEVVLDLGCGEGKETLLLARLGLGVVSVDLSFTQLSRARDILHAQLPDAPVSFVQADAEEMPFAEAAFRSLYGKAILHHLDTARAAREIGRALGPGGRAVLAEPLAYHPLFWLARRLTPQLRTRDERPLHPARLPSLGEGFSSTNSKVYFLLAPLAYPLRVLPGGEPLFRKAHRLLQKVDAWLLRRLPGFRTLAWYGMIMLEK